jgi:hypothetical protein
MEESGVRVSNPFRVACPSPEGFETPSGEGLSIAGSDSGSRFDRFLLGSERPGFMAEGVDSVNVTTSTAIAFHELTQSA